MGHPCLYSLYMRDIWMDTKTPIKSKKEIWEKTEKCIYLFRIVNSKLKNRTHVCHVIQNTPCINNYY